MKKPRGNEMRNFLIAASALVAVLIIAIVAIITVNSVRTLDQEQTKARQKSVDSVLQTATSTIDSLQEIGQDPRLLQFMNPEMIKNIASGGDILPYVESTIFIMRAVGSAEYSAYVVNGKMVTISARYGLDSNDYQVPTEIPESGYAVLNELDGKPGYYVEMFSKNVVAPSLGQDQFSVSVLDRTAEMKAIDDYYASERSSLIKKQLLIGLIGLVLALAICLVGLRLLTRHYITKPIEDLQHMSRDLMEGKLDAEVVVDEKSDFADLQRLLQSGKLLISKMDEME